MYTEMQEPMITRSNSCTCRELCSRELKICLRRVCACVYTYAYVYSSTWEFMCTDLRVLSDACLPACIRPSFQIQIGNPRIPRAWSGHAFPIPRASPPRTFACERANISVGGANLTWSVKSETRAKVEGFRRGLLFHTLRRVRLNGVFAVRIGYRGSFVCPGYCLHTRVFFFFFFEGGLFWKFGEGTVLGCDIYMYMYMYKYITKCRYSLTYTHSTYQHMHTSINACTHTKNRYIYR